MTTTTEDAREFGEHVTHGGWRLGLLVARNVEKGAGNPAATLADRKASDGKTSAAEFARVAGTSPSRVLRFLTGWEHAAEAGHVPHASTLTPGDNAILPDAEKLPWGQFYDGTGSGGRPRDAKPVDAVTIMARRGLEAVVDAMPDDMRREMFVALSALLETTTTTPRERKVRGTDTRLRAGVLLSAMYAADTKLRDALGAVRGGEVERIDEDDRQRLHIVADRMRRALDLLDMAAGSGIDDAELEAWLNDAKGDAA